MFYFSPVYHKKDHTISVNGLLDTGVAAGFGALGGIAVQTLLFKDFSLNRVKEGAKLGATLGFIMRGTYEGLSHPLNQIFSERLIKVGTKTAVQTKENVLDPYLTYINPPIKYSFLRKILEIVSTSVILYATTLAAKHFFHDKNYTYFSHSHFPLKMFLLFSVIENLRFIHIGGFKNYVSGKHVIKIGPLKLTTDMGYIFFDSKSDKL